MANKTFAPNPNKHNPNWIHIDASGKVLGKVATEASQLLIGKHKPTYAPNQNMGDHVVITNADKIAVTGNKMEQKVYYRHSGYPGGLKSENLKDLMQRRPTEVLRRAIHGMLPKNKLRNERISNLHIYAGDEHPHQAQLSK